MISSDHITDGMTISAAVDRFFRRVLADPAVAHYFDGAELHRLASQQRAFLARAFGVSEPYAPVVAPVSVGAERELVLLNHLAAALRDVGMTVDQVDQATAAARQTPPAPLGGLTRPVATVTLPQVPEFAAA